VQYRPFGKLGWNVSAIGFGAWAIGGDMWGPQDDAESVRALHTALDHGVNFIDTAQGYGDGHSETVIGRVLAERSGDEIYVATKVPPRPGHGWPPPPDADATDVFPSDYFIEACEQSLRRLGRDHLDVYQFHTWVSGFNQQDEWKESMAKLKEQGKVRAVGVSVPDTTPANVIGSLVEGVVDSVQVIYNLFDRVPEWNLFPVCEHVGTAVIVRVPFDEGALTGKFTAETTFPEGDVRRHYFRGANLREVVRRVEEIRRFKDRRHPEMSLAEYALRFCLGHPAVSTVIPGTRTPRQAEMNTAAGDGNPLGEEERAELRAFAWRKDFWNEEVEPAPEGANAEQDG
jgi:aryl-alcohol dehydrogenase-like predicted oxidoreductase